MAFQKPKKQPEFADLKGILAQTKDKTEHSLYQTVAQIIDRLSQMKVVTEEQLQDINNSISSAETIINITANKKATYHTKDDETLNLPNSWQLLAGTNITFDDTIPNKRTINASGGGGSDHYDCPLTDGDTVAADLIFAAGECIIVQVPV
jgi:molybdopterin converting factor small subunit